MSSENVEFVRRHYEAWNGGDLEGVVFFAIYPADVAAGVPARPRGVGGEAFRIAVLASGTGTNLQAILDRLHGREGIEVVAVASDKPDATALERARDGRGRDRGLPGATTTTAAHATPRSGTGSIAVGVDLIVLAGYMQLLSPDFVGGSAERIVNVHPALLPSFPGIDAVGQAIDHGVADHRGDGALRRRGGGLGADHPAAAGDGAAQPRPRGARGGDPRDRARAASGDDPADRRRARCASTPTIRASSTSTRRLARGDPTSAALASEQPLRRRPAGRCRCGGR